ncbi:hypothetical protein [Streptomyces mirabilis]
MRVYHGTLNTPVHKIELREGIQLRWTRIEETAEMTMDPGTAAVLTGLRIAERDLSLVHVLDLLDPGSTIPRVGLFFAPTHWEGEPLVREPESCTAWRWWPLDALPEPIVEYTRVALAAISRGALYTPMGWS